MSRRSLCDARPPGTGRGGLTFRNQEEKGDGSPALVIRPARREDLPRVLACLEAAFASFRDCYTEGAFRDTVPDLGDLERRFREMTILVAESGTEGIIGTVACKVAGPGQGRLRGMAVLPGSQGRGLGRVLLRAAEAELSGAGCTRVTLDTTRPLERAIRFYERRGYRHTGVVRDYYGVPLFEYEKILEGGAR